MQIRLWIIAILVACLTLIGGGHPVTASDKRALLVGVADYAESSGIPDLEGPVNDAVLMYDTLRGLWGQEAQIKLLVTKNETASASTSPPTRMAILGALAELSASAMPGDEVLVYLAGHGAQIPPRPGQSANEESDGLNEIFLPSDVSFTVGVDGPVIKNHILDDEIGLAIGAVMAKGATVWLIADSCHSGTLNRDAVATTVPRYVDLTTLATGRFRDGNPALTKPLIPVGKPDPADLDSPRATGGRGSFVGFFASHPSQMALERPFDNGLGAPGEVQVHGVFTQALVKALNSRGGDSFESIAQDIRRVLWGWGSGLPDPLFVGKLAAPAMVRREGRQNFDISIETGQSVLIGSGSLAGLQTGARLQLRNMSIPDSPQILADLVVKEVALDRARAFVMPWPDPAQDPINASIAAEGLDPARYRERWLIDRANQFDAILIEQGLGAGMSISLPSPAAGTQAQDLSKRIMAALDLMPPEIPTRIVPPTSGADLQLFIHDDRLAIAAANAPQVLSDTPPYSLPLVGFSPRDLADALTQIAKSDRIMKIASMIVADPNSAMVTASLSVRRASQSEREDEDCQPMNTPIERTFEAVAINAGSPVPRIGHCDTVRLTIKNADQSVLDVSPLYLDPQGRVFYLRGYPDGDWFGIRLAPGETQSVEYTEDLLGDGAENPPTGSIYLVILAVEADEETPFATDFRHLEGDLPNFDQTRGISGGTRGLLDGMLGTGVSGSRGAPPGKLAALSAGAAVIKLNTGRTH